MDSIQTLFSWQFLFICLAITAATFIVRKLVETILDNPKVPTTKFAKWWREFLLPILPMLIGVFGALVIKSYPYPEGFVSQGSKIVLGLAAGLLSGLVYRVIKNFAFGKIKELNPNDVKDETGE